MMTFVDMLEHKSRKTLGSDVRDNLRVRKDGTGVHTFVTTAGRSVGPNVDLHEFLSFLPHMTESRCPSYGSDD